MQNFLSSTNYTFTISFTSALLIEMLSSLQSFHLILQTLSHSTSTFQTGFQTIFKHLPFFTEAYKLDNDSPLSSLYLPAFNVIAIYFALHLCLFGLTGICIHFKKTKSHKKLQRILNMIYLVHSRILFFPVQFFFLGLLNLGFKEGASGTFSHVGFKIGVILLSVLNFGLALIKEFLLKSIAQSKNAYSIKTNSYHQGVLIHKTLALLFYYLSFNRVTTTTRLSSVLHVLYGVFSVYILYKKLPFYNFQLLKLAVITSSLQLSLSIICILQVCVTGFEVKNSLQILFLFLPVLIIKISLSLFQRLFVEILQGGNLKSPEYIIHYALLLKNFAFDDQNKAFLDQSFYPTQSVFMGALSGLELENIRSKSTRKKYQYQLYESILENIKRSHKRNLESSLVIIFMAHVYLNKLESIVKAMKMIKRLESKKRSSIYHKALIDYFYCKLDKTYAGQDDEQQKGLASSLKEYEAVNLLKNNILEETKKQIAFWEIMKCPNIDIQGVYELGKEIEMMSLKIKKQCDNFGFSISGSNKISLTSGLIYAVYLKIARHLPHQGAKLLKRMQAILFSQDFKDDLDIQQQTGSQTVLVISLSKSKIGKVIEVSGPLETVFGFKKREIIGQKFGILFPKFIAKNLQVFLQKYAHDPKYKLDNRYSLYGRTSDNELFELEAHLQLFPYLNRKITVMMTLKRLSYQQSIMIADHDGHIVECSEGLQRAFENQTLNVSRVKYMRDLSPELDQANNAFNIVISQQNEDEEIASTVRRQNNNSYEKIEDLMTSPRWRNNSAYTKLLSGPNLDTNIWVFSDGNQDGSLTSRSKQFENIKTLRVQSIANSVGPLSPMNPLNLSGMNRMSLEEAQELSHSFEVGRRVIFSLKASSSSSMNIKPLANVRISLLRLCDPSSVYKVIHIPQVYSEQVSVSSPTKAYESPRKFFSCDKKVVDNESESATLGNELNVTETKNSLNYPKIPSAFKFFNFKEQLPTTERTLSPSTKRVTFPSLTKEQEIYPQIDSKEFIPSGQNTTPVPEHGDIKEGLRGGIANSIKNSSYREIRALEMLNSIGTNKKPHDLYYYFQYLMYLVIIFMIILVSINFYWSRKSIREVEDGVNIVSVATWKISALMQTWQRFIGIPSLIEMGTPGTLYVAELWKGLLPGNIQTLVSANNDLKQKIANADEKSDLIKNIFVKDIELWIESETGEKKAEMFDMFTANDVLVSRFLAIKDFSFSDPNIIYVLNNTANDYFRASDQLITNAGTYLQATINDNISRLRAILAVECIILVALSILLIAMPVGILKTYNVLFNTLAQIEEGPILAQIEPLEAIQNLLEGEIDAKGFIIDALDIFGDDKTKSTYTIGNHQNRRKHREERVLNFKRLKISLVKNTFLALCFVPLFAGIFSDTLVKSNKTFSELQTMSSQIVLASKVSTQTLLSLCALDYERTFYNSTDMLLFGASPKDQVYEILSTLDELNNELPEKFLLKGGDNDLQGIFEDDVCSFVSDDILDECLTASQETKMNLISLSSKYYEIMTYYTTIFNSNPTESNGLEVFIIASGTASSPLATLQDIYDYIIKHLLAEIINRVDRIDGKVEKQSIILWIIIVVCAVFIKWYTMEKLLEYDVGRRKILKIIPLSIIQNDKALKFYFRRSFPKEVRGAREFLL